jgi:hypothetical protein
MKINTAVTNLNVQGISMSHCWSDKNMENIPLNWLNVVLDYSLLDYDTIQPDKWLPTFQRNFLPPYSR